MKYHIYADHAATTQLDAEVLEAMRPFFHKEFGNPSSLYRMANIPKKAIKEARKTIADCIGAKPTEIYFTSGGSESDNWALKGIAFLKPKEHIHIITSLIEHHAIIKSCKFLEEFGHKITYLSVDNSGVVSVDELANNIQADTRLVSVMLANNETGSIEPIRELVAIAHQRGAVFHTDAVQALGRIPVNVEELGVDMLSASSHKFNGPRGVGFLYKRNGVELRALIHGGAQEVGYRAGTENVAGIVGMAKALQLSCQKMKDTITHVMKLRMLFVSKLNDARINYKINEAKYHLPGTINVSFKDADGEQILNRLDLMGIAISTGSACNSESKELSHVIKALNLSTDYAYGTIRITLGYENTEEDVCNIAEAINRILK